MKASPASWSKYTHPNQSQFDTQYAVVLSKCWLENADEWSLLLNRGELLNVHYYFL